LFSLLRGHNILVLWNLYGLEDKRNDDKSQLLIMYIAIFKVLK